MKLKRKTSPDPFTRRHGASRRAFLAGLGCSLLILPSAGRLWKVLRPPVYRCEIEVRSQVEILKTIFWNQPIPTHALEELIGGKLGIVENFSRPQFSLLDRIREIEPQHHHEELFPSDLSGCVNRAIVTYKFNGIGGAG